MLHKNVFCSLLTEFYLKSICFKHFYTRFCSQMLRELIPADLLKVQSSVDWKRTITAAYNQDTG